MPPRLYTQQRVSTCAVAALRTVLDLQFGCKVAEAALVALGRTPTDPIEVDGVGTRQMRRMVRRASEAYNPGPRWTLRTRRWGGVRALAAWRRRGRWPIVRVHRGEEYHSLVVLAVEGSRVQVFDPSPPAGVANPRWLDRRTFEAWWTCDGPERWWAVVGGGA